MAGITKAKAVKLYIDEYYSNLIQKQKEREDRREKLMNEDLSEKERKLKAMALEEAEREHTRSRRRKQHISDYEHVTIIGRGAFGEVRLVRKIDCPTELYAMKIMNKSFVIEKNQLAHARAERDALVDSDYAGVVKLYATFQDDTFLYFVMEYLPGGDLMNLLIRDEILSEEASRFYISELVQTVHAVHTRGYIHRDLKPDNILVGKDGHIKLSDFGLCTSGAESHLSSFYQTVVPENYDGQKYLNKIQSQTRLDRKNSWNRMRRTRSYSTVGTSNYMAPEILQNEGYANEVDWWSIGIILYECIFGYAPFSCENPTETCMLIMEWEKYLEFPDSDEFSNEVIDLLKRLICGRSDRLDYQGILRHPWFNGVDWDNIKNMEPPWIPELNSQEDTKYFDDYSTEITWEELLSHNYTSSESPLLNIENHQDLPFVGWTWKRFEAKERPSLLDVFPEDGPQTDVKKKKHRKSKNIDKKKKKKRKKSNK
eukprot:TRINITY_DN8812_c0_g1_i1.p1 TRINITY_DN8812_c0_g1~~TRINITY_DN8812_c0_g1_i1.p1  ORF type:complete len:484 (-),score=118.60 TRINITY_DN8812_c0_g1_i1:133-1584(-)